MTFKAYNEKTLRPICSWKKIKKMTEVLMKLLLSIFLGILLYVPGFAAKAPLELSFTADSVNNHSTQYYSYNFGGVRVNWSQYADFYLRNSGNLPLRVRGVYITGSSYWAWSNCPRDLYPGQRCLTRVEFRPWSEGSFYGRLRFAFPDGNIYIDLFGWGVRY